MVFRTHTGWIFRNLQKITVTPPPPERGMISDYRYICNPRHASQRCLAEHVHREPYCVRACIEDNAGCNVATPATLRNGVKNDRRWKMLQTNKSHKFEKIKLWPSYFHNDILEAAGRWHYMFLWIEQIVWCRIQGLLNLWNMYWHILSHILSFADVSLPLNRNSENRLLWWPMLLDCNTRMLGCIIHRLRWHWMVMHMRVPCVLSTQSPSLHFCRQHANSTRAQNGGNKTAIDKCTWFERSEHPANTEQLKWFYQRNVSSTCV